MQIETTQDYSKFKFLNINRAITKNFNLEFSFDTENDLKYFPVIVNQDFNILDGQHRFEYCKSKNLPIHYVIKEDGDIKDVRRWNNTSKRWTTKDYLESFLKEQKEPYIWIDKIIQKYGITLNTFLAAMGKGGLAKNIYNNFKREQLDFKFTKDEIESRLIKFVEIRDELRRLKVPVHTRDGYLAIFDLINHSNYHHAQFMNKMMNNLSDTRLAFKLRLHTEIASDLIRNVFNKGRGQKI